MYRETYKLGTYNGSDGGFYNPHTDTQGGMSHRKVSFVLCLSDSTEYEGGVFKFIDLKKNFKFTKGDAIFFNSELNHGVEPVTDGIRNVLISFLWDQDGENIRTTNKKDAPINYIPTYYPIINNNVNIYHEKIISFSLWGNSELYNYGMLENAIKCKEIYPDYMVYIYHNETIMQKIWDILKTFDNVKLIMMYGTKSQASNTFWRFTPAFESDSIVLIRDSDSIVNIKEKCAVNEFLESTYDFHIMRDSPYHKQKIMGGMWGCRNGVVRKLNIKLNYNMINNIRGADQQFLDKNIYDKLINSILSHNAPCLDKFVELFNENKNYFKTQWTHHVGYIEYYTPLAMKLCGEEDRKLSRNPHYSYHNNNKYIYPILPDSGPGNQIVGIKEALILAKLLNRICIIPPIRDHYLKGSIKFYKFDEIYKCTLNNVIIDGLNSSCNNEQITNVYCIQGAYHNKKLHNDQLIKCEYKEILLNQRSIRGTKDLSELSKYTDQILIIKHLFNNVAINQCINNGCSKCPFNQEFLPLYKDICKYIDFSDTIKQYGNLIINTHLSQKYIAIHLRYPDVMDNKTLLEYTNNLYDENTIYDKIKEHYNDYKVYISTNKINLAKSTKLKEFIFFSGQSPYESFIDQYICSKAEIFFFSPFNDYNYINSPHTRSTFSSFIIDYRLFNLNVPETKNINIINI